METLEALGRLLLDAGITWLNGFLVMAYTLLDNLPHLLALAAVALVLRLDRRAALHDLSRPGREGRPEVRPDGLRAWAPQGFTATIGLAWSVAALAYPQPVPWIGAAMWWGWLLALAVLPGERAALLWRGKGFLLTYALALLGFRTYLATAARFDPAAWAEILGSSGEAKRVIAGNLAIFSTVGTWLTWFVLPLAHFSYLIQRLLVNPLSLAAPFATVEELMAALRGRRGSGYR